MHFGCCEFQDNPITKQVYFIHLFCLVIFEVLVHKFEMQNNVCLQALSCVLYFSKYVKIYKILTICHTENCFKKIYVAI